MSGYSDDQVREIERERESWKRAALALSRRVWGCASCRSTNFDRSDGPCPHCGQPVQEYDGAVLIARWNTEDGMRADAQVREMIAERDQLRSDVKFLGASYDGEGGLVINMAKYHAVHRCEPHRSVRYTEQDLDDCMVCRLERAEKAEAEVARLRAQVARLRGLVRAVHEGCDGMTWTTDPPSQCPTCALLAEPAPEGQRCTETVCHEGHVCGQQASRLVPEAEWRALVELRDSLATFKVWRHGNAQHLAHAIDGDGPSAVEWERITNALAAVEQARRQEGRG